MPKTTQLQNINPSFPSLNHLKEEYEQRLSFAAMSDGELYSQTLTALEASYDEKESPFHYNHTVVDMIREEWDRRNKPNLFSKAFRKL